MATSKTQKVFPKFTGKKKQYFDALMSVREKVVSQVKFHADEALNYHKDSAGEVGMATHMADLGSDNFRHDMELQMLTEEGSILELIEEAMQRLKDNEYGECLDCGDKISQERLMVKPYACYCIACKSRMEKEGY